MPRLRWSPSLRMLGARAEVLPCAGRETDTAQPEGHRRGRSVFLRCWAAQENHQDNYVEEEGEREEKISPKRRNRHWGSIPILSWGSYLMLSYLPSPMAYPPGGLVIEDCPPTPSAIGKHHCHNPATPRNISYPLSQYVVYQMKVVRCI